jgi:hypothetical protein
MTINNSSTLYLKFVIVLMGVAALAVCIFALPPVIRSTEWIGYRPILLGMYATVIPFFIALYQTLKLLGHIDASRAFSDLSVKALKAIKYCGLVIALMYTIGMPYIYHVADLDDAPDVIVIGLVIICASISVSVFAAVLEKLVKNATAIKSENDLTV